MSTETFVLDIPAAYPTSTYYPANDGQLPRYDTGRVQPGTYPVRIETSPVGDLLAVVDLDVVITSRMTWKWRVLPCVTWPYASEVQDVAWHATEVIDGLAALSDDDGTPLATWRRIA